MFKLGKKEKKSYRLKAVLEEENRKKLQNALISYHRMIFLMGLITIVILVLLGRVYYLTINQSDYYASKLLIYQTTTYTSSVPRGSIYDRNGKELVSTTSDLAIMYYPTEGITNEEEMNMAKMLVKNVDIDISSLSLRDKKDYFILYCSEEAEKLITDDEWTAYYAGELKDNDIYNLKLERITEDLLDETWSEYELKAVHVYYLMNKNGSDPSTVVEGVSEKEASYVAEHSDIYKGMYVSYTYERIYSYGWKRIQSFRWFIYRLCRRKLYKSLCNGILC